MEILIVESNPALGGLWRRHMERQGMCVALARGQDAAIEVLRERRVDVIVLNLFLAEGSALAVADFASYRHPETRIVFVTDTSFFSDGSIFAICANARAFLQSDMAPEDLTAMVAHYGDET
ncbi:response regulator [Roseovarius sp. SCSIO 43702]|uniref:response regulator n=1 Tax=Roseovarius sp. SCSIO 43702 TaxID=2823043 RepID=UPI001C730049|nr:response regulator [Roseovarius sp. SCSIO 43702]QYX55796.1 response regulator [Roseovarius sp. SCSIO 43702]